MKSLHGWKLALAIFVGLLVALVIAFSVPWKLNFARGFIAERALQSTGRSLQIEGDVWWRWGRIGRLSADRLRFANPEWAGRPDMVTAGRVELGIALMPLLHGRIELHDVRATRPDVWIEKQGSRRNWYLDTQQSDSSRAMAVVGPLQLDEGQLTFVDPDDKTRVEAALQSRRADDAGKLPLSIDAHGQLQGMALKAQARIDDVLSLRQDGTGPEQPTVFELHASLDATELALRGSVTGGSEVKAADLKLSAHGPSLGDWYRIAHVGVPESPPYRTEGRLRYDGKAWTYEDFTATLGHSDVSGRVVFEQREQRPGQQRPRLSGKLVSRSLDLRDFGPTVGKPVAANAKADAPAPSAQAVAKPSNRTTSPSDRAASAPNAASAPGRRVLPQQHFDAERWGSLDADIEFTGASVRNLGKFPLDDLVFRLRLDNRRLQLDPVSLKAGGGNVSGRLQIDGAAMPMRADLDATWRGLKLDTLLPQMANSRSALGTLNGRAKLSGQGASFAQILGTAHGDAQLAMGSGRVSNLLVELLDLDAFEAIAFLVRGDKDVSVRCAVIDAAFEHGVMTPRTAVFDTTDTFVQATGHVDFAQEQLALRLTPLPKDISPLTARVPIDVKGSFAQPSVTPDKAKLAVRGGSAVLLGLINPLASLLALIETGPGKDADCANLTALARKDGVPVKSEAGAKVQNGK